jgi:hypothetical protein
MRKCLNLNVITEESEVSGGLSEQEIQLDFPLHKDDFLVDIEKRSANHTIAVD